MGMLDGLLGSALGGLLGGGGGGQQSPLMQIVLQMLQQNGGISGTLDKFRQAGYAQQADSWQSTGQNLPIEASALQEVLGSGALAQIAQQLGMSRGEAAGGLAQMLPEVIDKLTPNGQVPANQNDMVEQALALLTKSRMG